MTTTTNATATTNAAANLGFVGRLRAFADNIFEPKLHIAFAALWSLSLLGNLYAASNVSPWRLDPRLGILVFTVFVCLFFLRMVDEVKDYDYDVIHNSKRPLVSGLVTRADIARYLVVFAAIVLALNAAMGVGLALWVLADIVYGLLQIPIERRSRTVRENLIVNLVTVYPVNVGLSVYTVLYFLHTTGAPFSAKHALLVVAYACAFLHFEVARKSSWPHLAVSGERLYSQLVGLRIALLVSVVFAFAALGAALWAFAPWAQTGAAAAVSYLPLLALVPMARGLALHARNRETRHSARPMAVAFLFAFYVTMLVRALVVTH